jgi:hypothetical protein
MLVPTLVLATLGEVAATPAEAEVMPETMAAACKQLPA